MARILLCVAAVAVTLLFGVPVLSQNYKKVECTADHSKGRDKIIEQVKCGNPKPVFMTLAPSKHAEMVIPRQVWVNRCTGLCEFGGAGTCFPTEVKLLDIPVRIHDGIAGKASCATYLVDEDVACGCCEKGPGGCAVPKVLNPPSGRSLYVPRLAGLDEPVYLKNVTTRTRDQSFASLSEQGDHKTPFIVGQRI